MPRHPRLNVKLVPEFRKLLTSFVAAQSGPMTLCFIKGRMGDATREHWIFGAYGAEEIAQLEKRGVPFLYDVDGLAVALPDWSHELVGTTLGRDIGHIEILARSWHLTPASTRTRKLCARR